MKWHPAPYCTYCHHRGHWREDCAKWREDVKR